MDALFLIAYVLLVGVAFWRARRLAWLVIAIAVAVSLFGLLINLSLEFGVLWSRTGLQVLALVALAAVALAAFVWRPAKPGARWSTAISIGVPVVVLLAFFTVVTWVLAEGPAFFRPVSYLIGHGTAEDNAEWLDFTAKFATGEPITQGVPLGGPLQLTLTVIGTLMGVLSVVALGGYNEVAVAANTVVLGSYILAAIAPLALAPLADGLRRRAVDGESRVGLPWPLIWVGASVLVSASLVVTAFGHLTFQYTLIVMALWSATFLSGLWERRALLMVSLVAAATATVWLPLNAMAAVILLGWLGVFVVRLVRRSAGAVDPVGWLIWGFAAVALWRPTSSSLAYVAGGVVAATEVSPIGGAIRGISAMVINSVRVGANDSSIFASPGGTEQVTALLVVLAAAGLVGAAWVLVRSRTGSPWQRALGLVPVVLLLLFAAAITLADFWITGEGPNYGSSKFAFLAVIVTVATCAPLAISALDWPADRMTLVRWAGAGAVLLVLVADTLLPRALAATRPAQWSPPIPFENTSGSYWYPADVNGTGTQTIADNPVACVYLPQGAPRPTALLESQLSDAQRVYSCTRLLTGLSGMESDALILVDWLRREWLTNTPAWAETYPVFEELPEKVKNKKVILLDDGSNVIGLETFGSLLSRYPKFAGLTAEELAALGVDPNAG